MHLSDCEYESRCHEISALGCAFHQTAGIKETKFIIFNLICKTRIYFNLLDPEFYI